MKSLMIYKKENIIYNNLINNFSIYVIIGHLIMINTNKYNLNIVYSFKTLFYNNNNRFIYMSQN